MIWNLVYKKCVVEMGNVFLKYPCWYVTETHLTHTNINQRTAFMLMLPKHTHTSNIIQFTVLMLICYTNTHTYLLVILASGKFKSKRTVKSKNPDVICFTEAHNALIFSITCKNISKCCYAFVSLCITYQPSNCNAKEKYRFFIVVTKSGITSVCIK
jgi:hypothetical protein